jgi:hypothetical protein
MIKMRHGEDNDSSVSSGTVVMTPALGECGGSLATVTGSFKDALTDSLPFGVIQGAHLWTNWHSVYLPRLQRQNIIQRLRHAGHPAAAANLVQPCVLHFSTFLVCLAVFFLLALDGQKPSSR